MRAGIDKTRRGKQRLGQPELHLRQATAHGADGNRQDRRQFLIGLVAAEIAQHGRDPQRLGKVLQGIPDPVTQRQFFDLRLDACAFVGNFRQLGHEDFALPAAQLLQAAAAQDCLKPGTDRVRITHVVEAPQGDQECLMHRVFGFRGIAEHLHRRREEARTVALQQHAEAAAITAACCNQQLRIRR